MLIFLILYRFFSLVSDGHIGAFDLMLGNEGVFSYIVSGEYEGYLEKIWNKYC